MLLNYGLQQKAPNIVSNPKSNMDVNSILGLSPSSQYSGFQTVGDTGYFMKDNKLYQPYTPAPRQYFYMGSMNQPVYYNPNNIMGVGAPSVGNHFGMGNRWQSSGGAESGTIYSGEQAFKPIKDKVDLEGFIYNSDKNTYDPSMAYVYANTPRPKPVETPNVASFLSAPTAPAYTGNYGAGRFLGGNGLLGLDFGLPSGQSANE